MKYMFHKTVIPFDYDELKAPDVTRSEWGWEVTRTIRCAYVDRFTLAMLLYGRSGSVGQSIYHVMEPHRYELTGVDGMWWEARRAMLFCNGVSIKEWGDPTGGMPIPLAREHIPVGEGVTEYLYAELKVDYSTKPWFYEERFDAGGSVIGITAEQDEQLYWASDHKPLEKQISRPPVRLPGGTWTVIFPEVACVPDEVLAMRGKVNTVEMEALNLMVLTPAGGYVKRVFPVGTVLFTDAVITETSIWYGPATTGRGISINRVELTFVVKENGHNSFFRPGKTGGGGGGMWDTIDHDVLGTLPYNPYEAADLNAVLGL